MQAEHKSMYLVRLVIVDVPENRASENPGTISRKEVGRRERESQNFLLEILFPVWEISVINFSQP